MKHFWELFMTNAYWFVGTIFVTLFISAIIFSKPDKERDEDERD